MELVDSPYNGLNFCCGTAAEGLDDPKTELIPIVKHLVSRLRLLVRPRPVAAHKDGCLG